MEISTLDIKMTNYTVRYKILILRYSIIEYIICYIKEKQKNIIHI